MYPPEERARGQRAMVVEGVFSKAMDSVTGGVVLAAFALRLGATDLEIGLLAAIPFLVQLVHLPAIALLARWHDRRPLTVWAIAAARVLLLAMGLVPFALPEGVRVPALILLLILYAALATLSGAAWQAWMRDLVPREELGSYHGRRFAILALVGFFAVLAAGQFVAGWGEEAPGGKLGGYLVLYALGSVLGMISVAVMARAPSRPSAPPPTGGFRESLRRPLAARNYRRVLIFLGAWGFAANLALPFVAVVLLRTLGYGLGTVAAMAAISMAANYLGFLLWAPLTDRFGAKPALFLSATLFVVAMFGWAAVPKVAGAAVLTAASLLHALLGLATAGLDLGSTALTMKLAPETEAAAYLSTASLVKSVATGIAPLLGGVAATFLAGRSVVLTTTWIGPQGPRPFDVLTLVHHDFLFLASAVLGLYAVHRLLGFEEPGEAAPETVVRAMRRDFGAVGSVAGLRQFAHMASYILEAAYEIGQRLEPERRRRRGLE